LASLASLLVATFAAVAQEPWFELVEGAFDGGSTGDAVHAFTAVAADMDEDGDEDVLVNWHLHRPLELFENVGGRFRPVPVRRSGLDDNPGVPTVFAATDAHVERIGERTDDGIWIWHDLDRKDGRWHLWVRRAGGEPVDVHVIASSPIRGIEGAERGTFRRRGLIGFEVPLPEPELDVHLSFRVQGTASRVQLLSAPRDAELPPIRVGAEQALVGRDERVLWKPDPHGLAWVDLGGSQAPELFVGRGALAGRLDETSRKQNRFYRATPGTERLFELDAQSFPPELGRARQVQWVDARGSRQPELYVGNRDSENALYLWSREARTWVDRAPALGLDFSDGESFAWLDVDDDGTDELAVLDGRHLRVFARGEELAFVERHGLVPSAELPGARHAEPFHAACVHVVDVDANGRLDLWLTGLGGELEQRLYVRSEDGFVDRTEAFGLAAVGAASPLVTLDVDADGDEDALALGRSRLFLNDAGRRFDVRPIDLAGRVACPVDADSDGRTDLVVVGARPSLWRNASSGPRPLTVVLDESPAPVGAVIIARRRSGRMQARRIGSDQNPPFSQAIRPLSFGAPPDDAIERVLVRWPGGVMTFHPVDDQDRRLVISR